MKIGDIMEWAKCVGVIGAGECADSVYDLARKVGNEIGKKGWMLICGDWVVLWKALQGVEAIHSVTKFLSSG